MNDDKEIISLDFFDEDDFMLNKSILKEDNVVDSFSEKDSVDNLEVMEELNKEDNSDLDITNYFPIKNEIKENISNEKKEDKKKTKKKSNKIKTKKDKVKVKNKKTKKKFKIWELVFIGISVLFILGCFIYYGSRLIKYYKIYNPKGDNGETITLIASSLTSNIPYATEGEGIYRISGSTIYKGYNVNNYFKYSGLDWRILAINGDGSVDLVLDGYVNNLYYDNKAVTFNESNINKYLNTVFLNNINKNFLVETSYCADIFEDIISNCKNYISTDFVRMPSINEFLNTIVDGKTYMNNDNKYWLLEANETEVWHTNGVNISTSKANVSNYVKPVIRIKNSAVLLGGDGTKEKPYYVEDNKELALGNYIKLDNDIWSIYNIEDNYLYLSLSKTLDKMNRFGVNSNIYDMNDNSNIANYLNNTYLNSLSYKDKLLDNDWFVGEYNGDYESIKSKKVTAKVGMYSISDLKINDALDNYYLLTPSSKGYVYFYNEELIPSKVTYTRNIKPTIKINKNIILSGSGTYEDPYILGGSE